jgi:heme/copper-type cytochrome/quinol oxidase subunit 3
VAVITTEAAIFASLLGAYFFVRATSPQWPQGGLEEPKLGVIGVFTVLLLASSIPLFFTEPAMARGDVRRVRICLAVTFVLGLGFLVNQGREYRDLHFGPRDNAYASLFYLVTGLHGLHVLAGLLINLVVQAKAATGRLSPERHGILVVYGLYWHFVDVVWIVVFSSLYLSVTLL